MYDSDVINVIVSGSATAIAVPPEGMEIGRSTSCLLQLDDPNISRRHARIVCGPAPVLVDLASKNGTYVNGELLQGSRELKDGDVIKLGARALTIRIVSESFDPRDSSEEITSPVSETLPGRDRRNPTMAGLGTVGRMSVDQTCPRCGAPSPVNATSCKDCGFLWPKARPKAATLRELPALDAGRRREPRRPLDLAASYSSGSVDHTEGTLENISSEGAFIRTDDLDSVGVPCKLTVRGENGDTHVIEGSVRHVLRRSRGGKRGMGIEFGKLSAAAQTWLSRVLRQLDGLD